MARDPALADAVGLWFLPVGKAGRSESKYCLPSPGTGPPPLVVVPPCAARTQVTLMGKKRKQTTVTDWAEIPDTMEPQITNMTMETMGEDWVAGPPEEYDCDLALYKAPNEVLVFAYTAYGKDIIDQLCRGHEWIELNAPDDFECLWRAGLTRATDIDALAADVLRRGAEIGLFLPNASRIAPYSLNKDGTVRVQRNH
jgi:hypothetical protein